ncbi:MAG: hypothetical protein EBR82_61315 [Caulobacteraceae bacterium]|nr:hypothetical protein [Caulobacteraceae bacterium]
MAWRTAPIGHPDRETAQIWAELYRQAMAKPDGVLSLGSNEDGFSLGQVNAKNPDTLVRLLENFARYGTFEDRGLKIRAIADRLMLRADFRQLLDEGLTKDSALDVLSDKYSMRGRGYSRSNIERKLGLRR